MKVLLINPKFPDTYWSFHYALPFEGKRSAFPPGIVDGLSAAAIFMGATVG